MLGNDQFVKQNKTKTTENLTWLILAWPEFNLFCCARLLVHEGDNSMAHTI